ncbi:MAG: hypothetical protein GX633_05870 [Clostridiales bacterium]|jgi:hypothetical protein|nr:hypothetical protein [Clostridiales bacterium]
MKYTWVSFTVASEGTIVGCDNRLVVEFKDNMLECRFYYSFRDEPLKLCADGKAGDNAKLIILPYRIELWMNEVLCDEEWPAGEALFTLQDIASEDVCVSEGEYVEIRCASGTIDCAEGWRPGGGVFVGDCMPYVSKGRYHVLYLKDRRHHRSKWSLGAHQWEHLSTSDFKTWEIHPMAVPIDECCEGSICTGSWIPKGEKEYLFYTVRMTDGSSAPIRRSMSSDGYNFSKDKGFSFYLSDRYDGRSARDPKLIRDNEGLYHMLLTTSLIKENRGCLAHLISNDLDSWEEIEPIYISGDETQPECPDYIEYSGRYYLIFSLRGKAHYMHSVEPFSGFIMPDNPVTPCSTVPKGAVWGEKIVFTGFRAIGGYAGVMTFREATANANGELRFE